MSARPVDSSVRPRTLVDLALNCGRFIGLHIEASPLIALAGSFRTHSISGRDGLLQRLAAELIACGSTRHSGLEIADALERRGVSLVMDSRSRRISFSALMCVEDLPAILELLVECLCEPRLDPGDVVAQRDRLIAELRYAATDPFALASDALARAIHAPGHPRHHETIEHKIGLLETFTVDDVRCFHAAGASDLCIVAVGGVDPIACAAEVDRRLSAWRPRTIPALHGTCAHPTPATTVHIDTPGYDSFAVLLGIGVPVRCNDADYAAVWLANQILGATHASRLVTALREERGLTYSIRSALTDPEPDVDGHWQIALSLSADKFEQGIATLREEIERFVDAGVSGEELDAKRRAAIGASQIDQATLQGLSETLLRGAECGSGADPVREFHARVLDVTPAQINRVITTYLRPAELHTVVAGPHA